MSDHEFDAYLGLLGRMLRLARSRREGIARELRDHLEDRLEELTAQGVPREEAIGRALEEFGDAAVLAAEFIQISRNKRRRWIMRCTMGVGVAAMVGLIVALSYWPGGQPGMPAGQAVADSGDAGKTKAEHGGRAEKPEPVATDSTAAQEAKIKQALDSPTQLEFVETPLTDVIDYLKSRHKIEIQLDKRVLGDTNIGTDTPVTRNLKGISLRSALNLMLRDLGLTYIIQDGVLLITTPEMAESNLTVVLYPVEELVAPSGKADQADYDSLIDLINSLVQPTTWDAVGGSGSIAPFENRAVLVVSQTLRVHDEIAGLLDVLREVHRARVAAAGKPRAADVRPRPIERNISAVKKINEALDSPTELEFVETPLSDVIDYLRGRHKIEIQLDKKALDDMNIGTDSPVTKNLKGLSLRQALRLLVREMGLTYVIRDEVLLITTAEQGESLLSSVLYPVGDLVLPPGQSDPAKADFDSLIDMITSSVQPSTWDQVGGPGAIAPYPNELVVVVSQTDEVQREIVNLLAALRRLPPAKTFHGRERNTQAGATGGMGGGMMGGGTTGMIGGPMGMGGGTMGTGGGMMGGMGSGTMEGGSGKKAHGGSARAGKAGSPAPATSKEAAPPGTTPPAGKTDPCVPRRGN